MSDYPDFIFNFGQGSLTLYPQNCIDMIQEFRFKNFKSFKDEAVFSLEPAKDEPVNRVVVMPCSGFQLYSVRMLLESPTFWMRSSSCMNSGLPFRPGRISRQGLFLFYWIKRLRSRIRLLRLSFILDASVTGIS